MKITHNKVGTNLNTTDTGKTDKADKTGKGKGISDDAKTASFLDTDAGAAKVDLSQKAQDMRKLKELATAAPDVNEEKVARLQKMIDEGKYKIDAKDIADKMVEDHLDWE